MRIMYRALVLVFVTVLFLLFAFVTDAMAQDKEESTQNFLIMRAGLQNNGTGTYRVAEFFQQRGKWIYPDVGYLDFTHAGNYREFFIGAGGVVYQSKRVTLIEEGYLDKAAGSNSGGALYFQPWTLVVFTLAPKLGAEVVYFPYIPLNKAGRIQHVLERAKLEYDFSRVKVGGGYGAYRFGDGPWTNRPFGSVTFKGAHGGALELWLQKMPKGGQIQVRYSLVK